MNLSPEQLAQVRAEEAAIAAKHAATQAAESKNLDNQRKNAKVYAAAPKSKTGRAWINRQCKVGQDPADFKVPAKKLTYCQVQFFENNKPGMPKYVLKVEWSTHLDPKCATDHRYQTKSYFNLYTDREITRRAKKYLGTVQGTMIASHVRGMAKECPVDAAHPIPEFMFGINSVRAEKRGTINFGEQSVVVMPTTTNDGLHKAALLFSLDGEELCIVLHDKTTDEDRKDKASKMVGYLQSMSEEQEQALLKAAMQRLKK